MTGITQSVSGSIFNNQTITFSSQPANDIECATSVTTPPGDNGFGVCSGTGSSPVNALASASAIASIDPGSFSSFEGNATSTVSMDFQALGYGAGGGGTPHLVYSATGVTSGALDIIYTYDAAPTPEPSTWFLMTAALVGGLVLRKRFVNN
jgi:hypothetical protein